MTRSKSRSNTGPPRSIALLPSDRPDAAGEEEEAAIFAEKFIDIFNEIARVFIVH